MNFPLLRYYLNKYIKNYNMNDFRNVQCLGFFEGLLADIPSEELMPYNEIPTKDQIIDFWSTEGVSIINNNNDLEEFKKYIAWELYDFSDYPRCLKKIQNRKDDVLNNNLTISFLTQSIIVSIGAKLRNVLYNNFTQAFLIEFEDREVCPANCYYAYKIQANAGRKSLLLINEKPASLNEQRILNFNPFPLKRNLGLNNASEEEREKAMKDYLCYLQSQNTINNINLELIYEMLNVSNYRNQVETQNEMNKRGLESINQKLSECIKKEESRNFLEELHSELKNVLNQSENLK